MQERGRDDGVQAVVAQPLSVGLGTVGVEVQPVRVRDAAGVRGRRRGDDGRGGIVGQHQHRVRRGELAGDELTGPGAHVVHRHRVGEGLRGAQQRPGPLDRAVELLLELVAPGALHLRLVPDQP